MYYSSPKRITGPKTFTLLLLLIVAIAEANHDELSAATDILVLAHGSREIAISGAALTNANNESAMFWNPALLG